jgi:hypothetical protein
MLADTFMNDNAFACKSWSEVTGLASADCAYLKRMFLISLNHGLWVGEDEYAEWLSYLHRNLKVFSPAPSAATGLSGLGLQRSLSNPLVREPFIRRTSLPTLIISNNSSTPSLLGGGIVAAPGTLNVEMPAQNVDTASSVLFQNQMQQQQAHHIQQHQQQQQIHSLQQQQMQHQLQVAQAQHAQQRQPQNGQQNVIPTVSFSPAPPAMSRQGSRRISSSPLNQLHTSPDILHTTRHDVYFKHAQPAANSSNIQHVSPQLLNRPRVLSQQQQRVQQIQALMLLVIITFYFSH